MKQIFKHSLLGVLLIALFASVCFADEEETTETKSSHSYRKLGFHGELGITSLIYIDYNEFSGTNVYPIPYGNLKVGYQINPYISVDVGLSTIILATIGELSTTINFTNTRVSPYVSASIGVATSPYCEYECEDFAGRYSGGAGIDFDITRHSVIYTEVKLWGSLSTSEMFVLPAVGYRFKF